MMKLVAFALLLLAASAANAADLATLDPKTGVLFSSEHMKDLIGQCSRDVPTGISGAWQPTAEQIRTLEIALPAALARTDGGRYVNLAVTFRQYVGLIVNGRKIIYINAFPRSLLDEEARFKSFTHQPPIDWKHQAVIICDGGAPFWGGEFDPSTETFDHFAFNGVG